MIEKKRNNLYVKHFPKENFSDEDLKKIFEPYGEILNAIVVRDKSGVSMGFGFVCFKEAKCAEAAFALKDKKTFPDCDGPLYLNYSMKKQERKDQLKREKFELRRVTNKLTIFVKIKNEAAIVSYLFNIIY
jgi:RNA recognition motif-containing protein